MCDDCGVSDTQYARARVLLTRSSWAKLYRHKGWNPAYLDLDEPTDDQVSMIYDQIIARHSAHPMRGQVVDGQYRTWLADLIARRETEKEAAIRAGC